ncbi:MAG: DUF4872 domain-containing protein, partial [Nannocystaceae bacterium]
MTHNKDFKQLVRQRMEKTGERYTTARANLLGELARRSPPRARHDQTFALSRLLRAHGRTDAQGAPLDEAWLLGLGGGVSFQYNTFEYSGHPPIAYLGTRCNPQYAYDDRFARRVLDGLGCTANVLTATSVKKAAGQLIEALGHGPVLCWVGREALLGDTAMAGATPWVVVVHDYDGEAFAVEDCFAGPLEVPGDRLAAARVAVKKQKHRLLGIDEHGTGTGTGAGSDIARAIWAGIEHCLHDLDSGVVLGGSAKNFGLAALEKWAGLANHPRNAKGWPKLFGHGAQLLGGLRQIWAWVHHASDGGAFRPMYADFLTRAKAVTGREGLEQAASAVAANG